MQPATTSLYFDWLAAFYEPDLPPIPLPQPAPDEGMPAPVPMPATHINPEIVLVGMPLVTVFQPGEAGS